MSSLEDETNYYSVYVFASLPGDNLEVTAFCLLGDNLEANAH